MNGTEYWSFAKTAYFMKILVAVSVADLGGGMEGMHPPHQPKSYNFGRKISPYFE